MTILTFVLITADLLQIGGALLLATVLILVTGLPVIRKTHLLWIVLTFSDKKQWRSLILAVASLATMFWMPSIIAGVVLLLATEFLGEKIYDDPRRTLFT